MVLLIILITGLVSAVGFSRRDYFYRLALSPHSVVHARQYYRLLSHMFVHGSWLHLLVNMLVFYSFAENVLGTFRLLAFEEAMRWPTLHFLFLYFGGGITSALLGLPRHHHDPGWFSVGASGGVSSVLFASIFFDPWSPLYIFGLLPMPGIILGVAYVWYSWRMGRRGGDHIDHFAHLYGAIFGFFYPLLINIRFARIFLERFLEFPWF